MKDGKEENAKEPNDKIHLHILIYNPSALLCMSGLSTEQGDESLEFYIVSCLFKNSNEKN